MKISLNWLKKYIDIKITPQKLTEKLTGAGLEVGAIEKHGADTVFEIEITSNRPDWLSYLGIAREVAAVTGLKNIEIPKALPLKSKVSVKKPFSIEIKDKAACPRYVGRLLTEVNVGSSPQWMKQLLEAVGSRLINSGADITNYCLYETGQPMHAFDFDKLAGGKIIVRRAKKGETIVTIDGVKRELDETILVIADEVKPVAVAGIMGGLDTEVTEKTKNILLESAFFDPVTIRRASRKLGLSTESNYRFERKVDVENVLFASCRAAYLYKEICAANANETFVDVDYTKPQSRKIHISVENVERLIGMKVPAARIKSILNSLGFDVQYTAKDMSVSIPSFRADVNIEEDLIEEIARVEGFENIDEKMPPITAHVEPATSEIFRLKQKLRRAMLALGLDEVMTLSLLSEKNLNDARIDPKNRLKLINPLSAEQQMMRNSFLPSLLKVINTNLNRKVRDPKIFEIGRLYSQSGNKPQEEEFLGLALSGAKHQNWLDHQRKVKFSDLKAVVELILSHLGIAEHSLEAKAFDYFAADQSAVISAHGEIVAELGKVDKQVLKNFDIAEEIFFAQINIPLLAKFAKKECRYQPVPKYPSVVRDIALVMKKNVCAEAALEIIRKTGGALAVNIELFDVYSGGQIPQDCKSLAFSIEYQSKEATLTEEQVNLVHLKVQNALLEQLGASLRS